MKRILLLPLLVFSLVTNGQFRPFRFAFISDTHIGSPNGAAEEDLRRTVRDINNLKDIAFVVLTGDITELGTNEELKLAKQILDSLYIPWYIIPGNHDTGWSESGGVMFTTIFGNDKFSFEHEGIRFLGCASGPYVRMSDGHVPRDAVNWLDKELNTVKKGQPVIFLNHYPIDNGLDNWYEITDRLRHHNTQAILCGHGHANKAMDFEDIPGVMGRSNLRARSSAGGYNLVDVRPDSLVFTERNPVTKTERRWTAVKTGLRNYDRDKKFPRPDYTVNKTYSNKVSVAWEYSSDANIISTPAYSNKKIVVGNQKGEMLCFEMPAHNRKWSFSTGGSIFSSPAIAGNKLVFGSGDGFVYCLDLEKGKEIWKIQTGAAVLGSPLVNGDTVFIGGSNKSFMALDVNKGNIIWTYKGLEGPVVSKPLLYQGKIIFGAWDRHLYALSSSGGELNWKWNNGSGIRNYSPAACIPVASEGLVYIVAPDRFISAIDANTGATVWRNNDTRVRESIGISENGQWIYGKTMQDTIAAYRHNRNKQDAAWKMHAGFGYEHVPSMLLEKDGLVYFGTKNGLVYCIDPTSRSINWIWKIDNSMVNTVNVLDKNSLLAATMDGKIVLLKMK